MPNQLDRDDAWFIVRHIGYFDLGDMEAWEWWFKNVWRRLEASKWFDELCVRDSPVYGTQQRITLFALRWIAEDFVSVLDGASDPEWEDWVSTLGLDAEKLLAVVRGHESWAAIEEDIRDYTGEAEIYDDPAYTGLKRQEHEEELMSRLLPQAACFAAARQRQRLVRWLRRIFVRSEHFSQSLWAVAHYDGAGPFGEDHGDNEDEVAAIGDEGPFAHESDPDLTPEMAAKLNRIAMSAFTDSLDFDSETAERLNAWEWVENGCRISNQGCPEYFGPWRE